MIQSIEMSLKETVKKMAQLQNKSHAIVWKELMLERWLIRLSKSEHLESFVIKGQMCLDHYLNIQNDNTALEFQLNPRFSDPKTFSKIIDEINQVDAQDGVIFTSSKTMPRPQPYLSGSVFESYIRAELGQTRTQIKINLCAGAAPAPAKITLQLSEENGISLYEKELSVWAYPIENIFAEKLYVAVKSDALNSRMADYKDLFLLISSGLLKKENALTAINQIFKNSRTELKLIGPFSKMQMERLENLWTVYKTKTSANKIYLSSLSFKEILKVVNTCISSYTSNLTENSHW